MTGVQTCALPISNLNSVALNTKVSSIQVSDSSDKIAANLGALSNIASKITTINQVGPRTNISVDASKLAELNKVLGKVDSGAYTLAVTGADTASVASLSGNSKVATIAVKNVLASNFASLASNTKVVAMDIKDTGANISANIGALLNSQSKITNISQVG